MLIPNNGNKQELIRQIRAELAQNRTDIQRLWRIAERVQIHPLPIAIPQDA